MVLVIPEKSVKEIARSPGTAKDTIKKLLAHKSSVKKHKTIKNAIPEAAVTPPSTHLQLLDYEGGIDLGESYSEEEKETAAAAEEEAEESDEEEKEDSENQIDERSLRGDVFCKFLCFLKCLASMLICINTKKSSQNITDTLSEFTCRK